MMERDDAARGDEVIAEWIEPLAASGAGALVGAVTTSAWQSTRDGIVELVRRRRGDDRAELLERELDATPARVTMAGADPVVRELLVDEWRRMLADLLAEHGGDGPDGDLARELRGLVGTIAELNPAAAHSTVQNVTISGGSVGQAVVHGNIVNHGPLR
jgi:hypothetical protein